MECAPIPERSACESMACKQKDPNAAPKVPKFWRDVLAWKAENGDIAPAKQSPICAKCRLDDCGARRPYLGYKGAEDPLITVILDSVSKKEDETGELCCEGSSNGILKRTIAKYAAELGVDMARIRWITTTRCANRTAQKVNYATKGNWCRLHAVDDLLKHPPKLIIPVGTTALGLVNHKSSANDWSGRMLTWRGWPDDWLTTASFVHAGHPLFGQKPGIDARLPVVPVQSPRLVFYAQNPVDIARWHKHIKRALSVAAHGDTAPAYDRP